MSAVPPPPPQPPTDSAAANDELLKVVLEGVPGGKILYVILKRKLWGVVAVAAFVGWTFIVYPLLLPLITATMIKKLPSAWHEPYAEIVRRAFRAEEFAGKLTKENNQRLDYFQIYERVAEPEEAMSFVLRVSKNQLIRYRVERATVVTEAGYKPMDKACDSAKKFDKQFMPIFKLRFQNVDIEDIDNSPNGTLKNLTAAQNSMLADQLPENMLTVKIIPMKDLIDLHKCAHIKSSIRLSFEVYKDSVI